MFFDHSSIFRSLLSGVRENCREPSKWRFSQLKCPYTLWKSFTRQQRAFSTSLFLSISPVFSLLFLFDTIRQFPLSLERISAIIFPTSPLPEQSVLVNAPGLISGMVFPKDSEGSRAASIFISLCSYHSSLRMRFRLHIKASRIIGLTTSLSLISASAR